MHIRPALLDDTQAISQLFRARIDKWQRLTEQGQVEDLSYGELSIYERWLHGGAWMSIETGAIWLSHLLSGAGQCVVVEADNQLIAYAELHFDDEPAPLNRHLYLSEFIVHPDADESDVTDQLLRHILKEAQAIGRLTVTFPNYDEQAKSHYDYYGLSLCQSLQHHILPAQTGQGFYQAVDYELADSSQIEGWYILVGRTKSSRQHWEANWTQHWNAIPQIREQKNHRQQFNVAGQDALVAYHAQLYKPRHATVYCWSPKPLTKQLIIAIQDWGHRAGFRLLTLTIPESQAKLLPAEAQTAPHQQWVYAIDV